MKRQFFNAIITILVLLLNTSLAKVISVNHFNPTEVKAITEYLSSPSFKGRLTGTAENTKAAEFIKSWFVHNNLQPYEGSYEDSFEVIYPKRVKDFPYLRVIDKDKNIVHEFAYGSDYKEDMLSFKENQVTFNKNSSRELENNLIQVIKDNSAFIFYLSDDNDLKFRSSFFSDSLVNMCVFLTDTAFTSLKDYLSKDYTVECYIPFEQKNTEVYNVLGMIEGRDKTKAPVILSSHFDHLGSDLAGTVYSGALDNASGTAFVMEMAKYIQSLGQPERSIVFISFNAEEFGCLGSKAFVEQYKEKLIGSHVFNFDMIGSDAVPLSIMGAEADTANTGLVKSVATVCSNENILFNYLFKDSSDHEYFRKNGIDAITFCDSDMSKIHTPMDQANYISLSAIERCFKVVSKEIIKYGYSNDPFIIYNNEILIYSFMGLAGLILIAVVYNEFMKD